MKPFLKMRLGRKGRAYAKIAFCLTCSSVSFTNCSGYGTTAGLAASSNTSSSSGSGNGGGNTNNPQVSGSPIILFTDALSGPVSGGENNLGTYLSIFGRNFGSSLSAVKVYIGTSEVANYRYLGQSKAFAKNGIEQITVQVGNVGGTLGTALPVKVVISGLTSNTDQTFTPNPGKIWFLSLSGNDSTAVANDINHPWRHLQTADTNGNITGGLGNTFGAGDHVIIRGGAWSDVAYAGGSWMRFRYPGQEGSAPTGKSGSGWIHITAYPGPINGNAIEDVHYTTPSGSTGGIQGANSAYYGTTGDYVSISNLHMDVNATANSDAAPINLQYSGGPWHVVNNELGPWPSTIEALAAGVSGHGANTQVYGNYIHDIATGTGNENHGIYVDSGGSGWDIGYNWISNITGGNMIQFFDNVGLSGQNYVGFPYPWNGFTNMTVHHNFMEGSGKYGLNMADGIVSMNIYNNVISKATYSGLRINTISQNMNIVVAYNTFYDNDQVASGSGNGQVLNTWGNYNPTGTIAVENNIFAAGPHTISTSSFYENSGSADNYLNFAHNLWFDNGYGWGIFSRDASGLYLNPLFNAPTTDDFTLRSLSPAIDKGIQSVPFSVTTDYAGTTRPQGAANDIGAFEFHP